MGNTTSTTITFVTQSTGGSGNSIAIELDEAKNGNKSRFSSGDTVFFRIYTSPLAMPLTADSSSGAVTIGAAGVADVTETITFANEKEKSLRYIAGALQSFRWFGRDLGQPAINGSQITIPAEGVGVLEVTYSAAYREGNLAGVIIPAGLSEFPVLVVIAEAA